MEIDPRPVNLLNLQCHHGPQTQKRPLNPVVMELNYQIEEGRNHLEPAEEDVDVFAAVGRWRPGGEVPPLGGGGAPPLGGGGGLFPSVAAAGLLLSLWRRGVDPAMALEP